MTQLTQVSELNVIVVSKEQETGNRPVNVPLPISMVKVLDELADSNVIT